MEERTHKTKKKAEQIACENAINLIKALICRVQNSLVFSH